MLKFKQDLIDELLYLFQIYVWVNLDDIYIVFLCECINQELIEEDLLSSCLLLICIMVQEIVIEVSIVGKIIYWFNNVLGNINNEVIDSISKSVESFEVC